MRLSDGSEVAAVFPASPAEAAPKQRVGRSYPTTLSVSVPVELVAEVDELAEAAGMSRSRWLATVIGGAVLERRSTPVEVRG